MNETEELIKLLISNSDGLAWRLQLLNKEIQQKKENEKEIWLGKVRRFSFYKLNNRYYVFDNLNQIEEIEVDSVVEAQQLIINRQLKFMNYIVDQV